MAAKKAKGIERKLPWAVLDRRETRVDRDEDGEHQKEVPISRQRALLKAGASVAAREAARSDVFGGSVEVHRAHESAAQNVASGGGNQEITADGYDYMVKSFESWAMFALPDDDGSPRQSKIISGGDGGMPVEDLDADGIVPPPSLTQCAPLPALAGQHRPITRHPCGWLGAHAAAHPGLKRPPTRSYEPEAPTHVGALMSSARLVPPSCHPHATPMPHPCHPHASPSHPHAILMPTPMPSGPCDAV